MSIGLLKLNDGHTSQMTREDFFVGQKLETPIEYFEDWVYAEKFVTVSDISEKHDIVHFKLNMKAGHVCSGIKFSQAKTYKG